MVFFMEIIYDNGHNFSYKTWKIVPLHYFKQYKSEEQWEHPFAFGPVIHLLLPFVLPQLTPGEQWEHYSALTSSRQPSSTLSLCWIPDNGSLFFHNRKAYFFSVLCLVLTAPLWSHKSNAFHGDSPATWRPTAHQWLDTPSQCSPDPCRLYTHRIW